MQTNPLAVSKLLRCSSTPQEAVSDGELQWTSPAIGPTWTGKTPTKVPHNPEPKFERVAIQKTKHALLKFHVLTAESMKKYSCLLQAPPKRRY